MTPEILVTQEILVILEIQAIREIRETQEIPVIQALKLSATGSVFLMKQLQVPTTHLVMPSISILIMKAILKFSHFSTEIPQPDIKEPIPLKIMSFY